MIESGALRDLGATGLARLLRLRPDAVAGPPPESLSDLAERLSTIGSVVAALRRLNRPTLEVAEAIAALGGDTDDSTLAKLLGQPDQDALDTAVGTLVDYALAHHHDSRITLNPMAGAALGRPLGLGITVAEALDARTVAELKGFAANLRVVAPTTRKADILAAVTAALRDPNRVTALVGAAPADTRELLSQLARTGEDIEVFDPYPAAGRNTAQPNPYSWAVDRAMLVRDGWGYTLSMPAEVALALRGPAYTAPFNPLQPPVNRTTIKAETVAHSAAASGASLLRLADTLLNDASKAPLATLKSGGFGVRETRRLAKMLTCAEDELNLCLDLVTARDLLAMAGDRAAPTAAYDMWVREEPADRLAQLIAVWWTLPFAPLADDDGDDDPDAVRLLRSAMLTEVAGEPSAVVDPEQLIPAVHWRRPAAFSGVESVSDTLLACWREAAMLGLTGAGAISDVGEALLAGTPIADALGGVGSSERTVRLQADLSAVVAGTPSPDLTGLLDLVADRETRGTASIWRLSPRSVRRALDAGHNAAELRERLSAVAAGGLPQAMAYLLDDVARTHGTVRASVVGCCLRSDDTVVLAEIVRDTRLRKIGLRLLAPTVLAAKASLADTLAALRGAGYAPVAEGPDGQIKVERQKVVRADPTPTRPHAPRSARPGSATPDPADIAHRLLAAPDKLAVRTPLFDELRAGSAQLSDAEIRMLAYAIDQRQPVKIGYINNAGNGSVRIIDNIQSSGGSLSAWCRTRQDTRWFNVSRIVTVEPVVE